MAITQKSVGQEEFDFLQALWGSGNGAGGGTATGATGATGATSTAKGSAAGVGATIGGAIATLIGSIVSDSGSNFRTKDKQGNITNPAKTEVKQEKSLPINHIGQLDQIENWANQMVINQPWNNFLPNNAIPQGSALPIKENAQKIESQYGYRPMDIKQEEAWAKQGGLIGDIPKPKDIPLDAINLGNLAKPKDIPLDAINLGNLAGSRYDVVGTPAEIMRQIAGELGDEQTGTIGAKAGAIPGEQVEAQEGTQADAQEGTAIPSIKQESMTNTKTKKDEIKPVEQQERDKGLPTIPSIPEGSNMEENIQNINYNNLQDVLRYLDEKQKEQWEREDAIRLETQEREDTAYQRAVADMRKSGVNPNLVGVNPAESGGGITQATGMDYSLYNAEVNKYIGLLQTELNNAFKEDENTKDRITDIIGGLINSVGWLIGIGISSKGKK